MAKLGRSAVGRREVLASALAATTLSTAVNAARGISRRKPNFVIILCDDLGYGDLGAFGGTAIKTPRLDRMAREGMVLTDYYAPASVCTPSRAGMLTGCYAVRSGMARGVLYPGAPGGLKQDFPTVARALKPDYATAHIGKWHLGDHAPFLPTDHGFDEYFGIPYSHDMLPLPLQEAKAGDAAPRVSSVDYPNLQQQFCAQAESFIERNQDRPFFLNLWLSAPHLPEIPTKSFAGRSAAGAYGDVVMEIDSIVGRVLDKLKACGLDRDTMVVFTSDNGPWFEGSAGGLRQRKNGGGFDGGYRVPCIVRQPGTIRAGARSDAIVMGIDFMPTFCSMAGVALPPGPPLDGRDISSVLTRNGATPHQELVLFVEEDVVAIRTQRWKYVIADWYGRTLDTLEKRGWPQLYDMQADRSESYSVASLHPDVLAAMQARLQRARAEFEPLRRGKSNIVTPRQSKIPGIIKD
ncbi:sulfatase [Sphingomonas sp.]|uniref:sulfatase family protein n=1 Tax=Sphingomonas sp. TaxID=28214 RepID=UPI0035C82136